MSNKRIIVEAKDILTGEVIRAECYEELAGKIVGVFKTKESVHLAYQLEKRKDNLVKPHHLIREYLEGEEPPEWPKLPSKYRLNKYLGYYRLENQKGQVAYFRRSTPVIKRTGISRENLEKARYGHSVKFRGITITAEILPKAPQTWREGDVFDFSPMLPDKKPAKKRGLRWHSMNVETGEVNSFYDRGELCEYHNLKPADVTDAHRSQAKVKDTQLLISRGRKPW